VSDDRNPSTLGRIIDLAVAWEIGRSRSARWLAAVSTCVIAVAGVWLWHDMAREFDKWQHFMDSANRAAERSSAPPARTEP
jgi:ABC-type nickel/cobalt efflux system permease component RcnA